jgi:EAL domain-containing protein (putative c-di-GMP-specific phosphodiesterase class I)
MKHAHVAASILAPLKDKGVRVSIDNFGTGYSSLGYLRKFPLDALKIDPSFVRQIDIAPDDTTIVSAIINMGQNLGLRIIAEGVETATDLQFLKTRNCDEAQGFYLGRPVPAEQFAKLLKAQ